MFNINFYHSSLSSTWKIKSSIMSLSDFLNELVTEFGEIERKCDECIEQIMAAPAEYTSKENIQDHQDTLKEELVKMLKRYDIRPVKIADYHYGFSTKLDANKRLIVFESPEDRSKCREYSAYRIYDQFCLQCRSLSNHKVLLYSRIILGILFIPVSHICEQKEYASVMEVQEKLKEGDIKAALSLQRKYAVKKHPRYLNALENGGKRPKSSSLPSTTDKPQKIRKSPEVSKNETDTVAADTQAGGHNNNNLFLDKPLNQGNQDIDHNRLLVDSDDAVLSSDFLCVGEKEKTHACPESTHFKDSLVGASTSNVTSLDTVESSDSSANAGTVINGNEEETVVSSSKFGGILSDNIPLLHPALAYGIPHKRNGGRKRGSKNLLFAKNSLDLIDSIKSLLPDQYPPPKRRRRRRKASMQAALDAIKLPPKLVEEEKIDIPPPPTNATALILDMIEMELMNNEKFASENSLNSDAENANDCEIIEENFFVSIPNEDQTQCMRTRNETITIDDD